MRKLLIFWLFLPFQLLCQQDDSLTGRSENYLTTDLLSPVYFNVDRNTPRWRLGYIYSFNDKVKTGVSIGHGHSNYSLIETGDDYNLWEIRPEFYLNLQPMGKTLKYVSLELFYLFQEEQFSNYRFASEYGYYLAETVSYHRHKFGIIPKYGLFIDLTDRFGLNFYFGGGINVRINDYYNFENVTRDEYYYDNEEHILPYFRNEGSRVGFELSLGLKLYYRMYKNR